MNNSKIIEDFLNLITNTKNQRGIAVDELHKEEALTQDLLHELELGPYKNRAKVSTELANCRKRRREHKDIIEELNPIEDWLDEDGTARAINKLKQCLGEVRKAEKYHSNREYKPKIKK